MRSIEMIQRHYGRAAAAGCATALCLGCASAGTSPTTTPEPDGRYHTTITLDSATAALSKPLVRPDTATGKLPGLTIQQLSEGGVPVKRIQLLDAGDKDLPIVLRQLAENFGLNVQIDGNVHGSSQTVLHDVTLEQALDAIVLPQGYTYSIDNGVLRVGAAKLQTKIFTLDYVALSRTASTNTTVQRRISGGAGGGGGGGADQISTSSIANLWDDVRVALVALLFDVNPVRLNGDTTATGGSNTTGGGGGAGAGVGGAGATPFSRVDADGRRLIINPISGTIVVTATPAKLAEAQTFMSTFESSIQRQVLIEAKIVEVRLNKDFQFGIDWSRVASGNSNLGFQTSNQAGTPTVQFSLGGGTSRVNLVLTALQTQGDVSVLSSPRVSAMNNAHATFNVTTDQVFFVVTSTPITNANGVVGVSQNVTPQTISVGIVLDVMPQIGADNTVTMNIRPHVTSVVSTAVFKTDAGGEITAPEIENRETDTMVRARGGETIVIGGLMQNAVTHTTTGVPGLQSLPIVGRLFRGTQTTTKKSELVIFITPTIVVGQPAGF